MILGLLAALAWGACLSCPIAWAAAANAGPWFFISGVFYAQLARAAAVGVAGIFGGVLMIGLPMLGVAYVVATWIPATFADADPMPADDDDACETAGPRRDPGRRKRFLLTAAAWLGGCCILETAIWCLTSVFVSQQSPDDQEGWRLLWTLVAVAAPLATGPVVLGLLIRLLVGDGSENGDLSSRSGFERRGCRGEDPTASSECERHPDSVGARLARGEFPPSADCRRKPRPSIETVSVPIDDAVSRRRKTHMRAIG